MNIVEMTSEAKMEFSLSLFTVNIENVAKIAAEAKNSITTEADLIYSVQKLTFYLAVFAVVKYIEDFMKELPDTNTTIN